MPSQNGGNTMPWMPTEEVSDASDHVIFVMLDGTKRVTCFITREALADLERETSAVICDKLQTFYAHRDHIMESARHRYGLGESRPVLHSPDVCTRVP